MRATWVATNVIPHERAVRMWLGRARAAPEEVDELIQDCYCRFASLDKVDHIERPGIYFYSMARRLLIRKRQKAKIVAIDAVAGATDLIVDDAPSPEREVGSRLAFEQLSDLMTTLPDRCRRIVEMRKFDGLSQREIAATLGVSESIVENDVQLAVRTLRREWRSAEARCESRLEGSPDEGRRA